MNDTEKKPLGKVFLAGLYFKNPLLSLFLGLTLAVLATSRLVSALVIAILILIDLLLTSAIISLLRKHLNKYSAAILALFISALIATVSTFLFTLGFKGFLEGGNRIAITLNVITPFITTSSLVIQKSEETLNRSFAESEIDALGSSLGYAISLVIIALFREILATGALSFPAFNSGGEPLSFTLWDSQIFSIPLLKNVSGGLLTTGVFSGIHLFIVKSSERKESK